MGGPLIIRPIMDIQAMLDSRTAIMALLRQVMIRDVDYGQLPGTPRPMLYKNGAEKLERFFGLRVISELWEKEERWSDGQAEAFFRYTYRARAYFGETLVGQMDGTCHSHEDKYRWRWLPETEIPFWLNKADLVVKLGTATEYKWAVDKAETTGPYGKPISHWKMFHDAIAGDTARVVKKRTKTGKEMVAWEIDTTVFRVPNPDVESLAHTIAMMAQKRAYVAVISRVTNASDVFMVSELVDEGEERDLNRAEDLRVDTRVYGNGQNGKQAAEEVFGKKSRTEVIQAIRAEYSKAKKGRDIPSEEGQLEALIDKLGSLGVSAEAVCRETFSKKLAGLDEAQMEAILAVGDDIKAFGK